MDALDPTEFAPGRAQGRTTEPPLVSVIMPSYNTARFIGEAIDSVLEQDYPHKELIVIDDGSTDGTVDVVRGYGERVRLITQHNQGAAVARNAGLAAARGELIAFQDSDDLWLPGKLRAQVGHLQRHPEVGLVYGRWAVWKPDADGRFAPARAIPPPPEPDAAPPAVVAEGSGWLYNRLLFGSLMHTITVMVRRSLIDRVGAFDPTLKRGQDYDYWIRASRETEIHQLDRQMARYRLHGEGCIRKWPEANYERLVVEKALARWGLEGPNGERSAPAAIRRRLADTSFRFGYHHFWEGDPRLALRAFADAAARRPGRPAAWRYLAMSALRAALPLRAARTDHG